MKLDSRNEQVEKVIAAWCTENGFGDDPVTVATFTDLAARLLSTLPEAQLPEKSMSVFGQDMVIGDECFVVEPVTDTCVPESWSLSSAKELVLEEPSPKAASTSKAGGRSSSRGLPDTSGEWRALLHDGDWWAAGHHMMYPARNENDARRLCGELARKR